MLSPAYDLTPTAPIATERRDLAMICGDQGRVASAANLLSRHGRFLLARDEAAAILGRMVDEVRTAWHPVARAAGVSARDCASIAPAFVYAGLGA